MLTLNSGAKVKVTHRLAPAELIHGRRDTSQCPYQSLISDASEPGAILHVPTVG